MKKPINLGFLGQKPLGETCFDILSQTGGFNISFGVSNYSKENWWKNNGIYQSCRRLSIPFVNNSYRAEDKIAKLIKIANIKCWKFDIVGFGEDLQFSEYSCDDNSHYDWH